MNWRTRKRPDLIPDLGELLVAAQLAAADGGHHLFMSHPQAEIAFEAVFQPEHVVAHQVPAAGLLPDFSRVQRRQKHLLPADGIHFFADDSLDFQQGSLGQKQIIVDARSQLAHVAGAQQ